MEPEETVSGGETFLDNLEETRDYIIKFWNAHSSVFMKWFLSLPSTGQVSLLRKASPDIPANLGSTSPSGLLVPELNIEHLLGENGKTFLRMMNERSRLSQLETTLENDLIYLKELRRLKRMPCFSGKAFDPQTVAIAYIDTNDEKRNIRTFLKSMTESSPGVLTDIQAKIESNEYIEADVWLSLQMRQQAILTFLSNIAGTFETHFLSDILSFNSKGVGCRTCGSSSRKLEGASSKDDNHNVSKGLLKCPCGGAFYCSQEHQKLDWVYHKESCKEIRDRLKKKEKEAKVRDTPSEEEAS